jgi:hypothetical protein
MNLKKTVAIAAAAGALAAISVPAMAFENEFHGMYKFKFIMSDQDNGGTASDSIFRPTADEKDHNHPNSYLEQRARLSYIAKANDDLKLVTHFELDARFGGTNTGKYGPAYSTAPGSTAAVGGVAGSNDGGALDSDGISLETKWVYLDFNVGTPTNVKVGIMPYKDTLKGIFVDADAAAVYTTNKFGAATVGLGFVRAYDGKGLANVGTGPGTGSGAFVGDKNTDLYILDTKYNLTKDVSLGLSYYFAALNLPNNAVLPAVATNQQTLLNTFGLNADAKIGAAKLSGFAAFQAGSAKTSGTAATAYLHGYALNVAGALPIGPGTFRTAGLLVSGDEGSDKQINAWIPVKTYKPAAGTSTGASTSSVTSYNESGMMLLIRNTAQNNTNTDRYMIGTPDNQAKGLILYTLGYDANITPKFYANTNLGFAWAQKNGIQNQGIATTALPSNNGTNFMGAELNIETGYKLYDNLTASIQAAYVLLGGAYNGSITKVDGTRGYPQDPYTGRVVLSYLF